MTAVAPVKSLPVMMTVVPPASGPHVGAKPEMLGAGRYPKVPDRCSGAVRRRHADGHCAGARGRHAVICVAELTVKLVALIPPNCTAVAPVKPVPVMTTTVPPAAGPTSAPGR